VKKRGSRKGEKEKRVLKTCKIKRGQEIEIVFNGRAVRGITWGGGGAGKLR